MSAIHLIKKDDSRLPKITLIDEREQIFSSGNWFLSKRTASELINGRIYFHKTQDGPSFDGGTIIKVESSKSPKRFVFYFRKNEDCIDVVTPRKGWSVEMKLVP
jgi:hypothetical protein